MSDAGDSSSSGFDSGTEGASEVSEGFETAETELYTSDYETELYDPGYDHSEYEEELLDFSYELDNHENPPSENMETTTVLSNDKGEPVGDEVPLYRSGDYLNYDDPEYIETGKHKVDWPEGEGYEGEAEDVVLPENTIIARYGNENGHYATDVGTKPTEISLPYDTDTMEYHEYRICSPISCKSGKASAAFDVEGGGKQYGFSKSFAEMVSDGTMEKIK